MRFSLIIGLVLLLGQPAFSQEAKESAREPVGAGAVIADPMKIANLQLDLLLEQRKAIEARAQWLSAEQKALNLDISAWSASRTSLQTHLDKTFGCSFDLDGRKCRPKE